MQNFRSLCLFVHLMIMLTYQNFFSSSNGFDFTQHKQRKEFAEKCFGDDPPIFETLKVISKDEKWKHKKAQHKLPNEIIYTG